MAISTESSEKALLDVRCRRIPIGIKNQLSFFDAENGEHSGVMRIDSASDIFLTSQASRKIPKYRHDGTSMSTIFFL